MKITNDRTAFYGIIGETIDIYQVEHASAAAFNQLSGRASSGGIRQKVIVGRDSNPSADMMEAAVCAALCAAGADVLTVGTVPSAAVSYLTSRCDALMGIMITGGSNNIEFSGLKFYQSGGNQITGELLQSIHASIDSHSSLNSKLAGKIKKAESDVTDIYIESILNAAENVMFEEMSVAIDCQGSSTEQFAAELFIKMGIDVKTVSGNELPSYENPSVLIEFVRDNQCDMGFAFSADGENCFAVDKEGKVFDIEKIAAVLSRLTSFHKSTDSSESMILVSENCHAALAPYISSLGVECHVISGDLSHLLEETENHSVFMTADRNSGISFPEFFGVPDGLLTAAMLLCCINKFGMSIDELCSDVPKFARATSIVTIPSGASLPDLGYTDLPDQINTLRSYLSGDGKITLTRIDKTKVNIIVEGVKQKQVTDVAEKTERLVRKNLKEKVDAPTDQAKKTSKSAEKEDKKSV